MLNLVVIKYDVYAKSLFETKWFACERVKIPSEYTPGGTKEKHESHIPETNFRY